MRQSPLWYVIAFVSALVIAALFPRKSRSDYEISKYQISTKTVVSCKYRKLGPYTRFTIKLNNGSTLYKDKWRPWKASDRSLKIITSLRLEKQFKRYLFESRSNCDWGDKRKKRRW